MKYKVFNNYLNEIINGSDAVYNNENNKDTLCVKF